MRKLTRSSMSGSSISSDSITKPLAMIPENSFVSIQQQLSSEDDRDEVQQKQSDDSETELVKRMSRVSGTFYEEVLDSIVSKLEENGLADERVLEVKKQLTEVVDTMVRNDPELEDQADGLYESLEEFGRKVSDYLLLRDHDNKGSDEDTPPALPPRPDFLLKLIKEDEEIESPVNILKLDGYEVMHTDEGNQMSSYEPILYNHELTKSPAKKKRRNSKIPFKKKSPEHRSVSPPTVGDTPPNKQHQRKFSKKLWKIPGRSIKIEPTGSLPITERATLDHYELMTSRVTPPSHMYVNVSQSGSRSQSHLAYKTVSNHDDDIIAPTYSSDSENDEFDVCADSFRSQSRDHIKIRWRGEAPPTPDSNVFIGYQERYHHHVHDPMTPPLVTKLSINITTPTHQCLRMSTSDPSLHSTSLHVTTLLHRGHLPPASPTPSPYGDLSLDSIDMDSTPSVCSYDSNRFNIDMKQSPAVMRKRVRSDASDDRTYSSMRRGAQQKAKLLLAQMKKRRGSLPGSNSEVNSVSVAVAASYTVDLL